MGVAIGLGQHLKPTAGVASLLVLPPLPGQLQTALLTGLAHFQAHAQLGAAAAGRNNLGQLSQTLTAQLLHDLLQHGPQHRLERLVDAALQQQRLRRHTKPIGREHAREGMNQQPADAQFSGQTAGQLGRRSAVAHQQSLARIVPPLQRHATNRCRHGFDGNLQRARGHLLGRDTRPLGRHLGGQSGKPLLHDRPVGPLITALTKHGGQGPNGQSPQHQIGIGDGERATTAIGRRARIGARRLWPHLKAFTVKAQDRATTGGHGVDWQHRRLQLHPRDGGFRAALPRLFIGAMEHVGGGPPHVETNHRLMRQAGKGQGLARGGHGTHHAPGGPGENRVLGQQQRTGGQRSARAHHPQRHRPAQRLFHLIQIAAQYRGYGRLHQGGLSARHQTRQSAEPMRQAHLIGRQRLQPGAEVLLMHWVSVAMQQRNGATAVAIGQSLAHLLCQSLIQLQWLQYMAISRQTTADLDHPHLQRVWTLDRKGKEVRTVQITKREQIRETLVDQQQHRGATVLQQGIGGHGGAEAQIRDQPSRPRLLQRQAQQRGDGVNRRITRAPGLFRQHLAHVLLPAGADGHHVRERAAAVDPDSPARRLRRHHRRGELCRCWSAGRHGAAVGACCSQLSRAKVNKPVCFSPMAPGAFDEREVSPSSGDAADHDSAAAEGSEADSADRELTTTELAAMAGGWWSTPQFSSYAQSRPYEPSMNIGSSGMDYGSSLPKPDRGIGLPKPEELE